METWKERLKEEYAQTKNRYEKLKAYNNKQEIRYRTGVYCTEKVEDSVRRNLMHEQEEVMMRYLHLLELRAELEGIEL